MKRYFLIIVALLLATFLTEMKAQDILTLEDALKLGMENNLGLQIARKSEEIASNNVSRGISGQLPSIGLNSNASYRIQNTKIEFSSPGIEPVDVRGAGSLLFGASIDASYVIFGGFRNQYQYELLQGNSALSSLETRAKLENIVFQVQSVYASVQAAAALEMTAKNAVEVSVERLSRTQEALRLGTGTSLTMMEAEVALKQDSVRLAAAQQSTRIQKRRLNRILQRDPEIDFSVEEEIQFDNALDLELLEQSALANNAQLNLARRQVENTRISEKIAKAAVWPTVSANVSYGYNRQDNDAGLIVSQSALGPVGGLSLAFPIFDGGLRNIQIQNARLALESGELSLSDQELQIRTDLANAFDQYQIALEQIEREMSNVRLAETVLERTRQLIELGQLSQLDFRTAQLNLQRSRDVLVQYRLTARQAELELMLLSGTLVQ